MGELPRAVAALVREAIDRGTPEAAILSTIKNALSTLLVDTGQRQSRIFFSYSHTDADVVQTLAKVVQQRGVDVWIDQERLSVGDSILTQIEEGLGRADYIVFFLSAASLRGEWTKQELNAAMQRRLADPQGPVIIPVLLDDSPVPALLRDVVYLDLRDRNIEAGATRLVNAVQRQEADRAARGAAWDAESIRRFKAGIRAKRR